MQIAVLRKPNKLLGAGRMLLAALLLGPLGGASALAQASDAAEVEAPSTGLASDIKAYVVAPLRAERAQWLRFGATMGAIALAYRLDDNVREHFGGTVVPPGQTMDTKDLEHALPAALALGGTWLAAAALADDDGRAEARSMLKAAAFGSAATLVLKEAAGRLRPYETDERKNFGDGGVSFPSMHTTAAFAIGTVLAESGNDRYRWARRALGYGIAAWTAYSRMEQNMHWLSDTIAGASIGIASARFVMKRNEKADRRSAIRLVPGPDRVQVSYTVMLR